MTTLKLLFLLATVLFNASFSKKPDLGLLTHDYGIVDQTDLRRLSESYVIPETLEVPTPVAYWRCLEPIQVKMGCNFTGAEEPTGVRMFSPQLTVVEGDGRFDYYTRRPQEKEACDETLAAWRDVIASERVICISASIDELSIGSNAFPFDEATAGTIERMKSRIGSWSYFVGD